VLRCGVEFIAFGLGTFFSSSIRARPGLSFHSRHFSLSASPEIFSIHAVGSWSRKENWLDLFLVLCSEIFPARFHSPRELDGVLRFRLSFSGFWSIFDRVCSSSSQSERAAHLRWLDLAPCVTARFFDSVARYFVLGVDISVSCLDISVSYLHISVSSLHISFSCLHISVSCLHISVSCLPISVSCLPISFPVAGLVLPAVGVCLVVSSCCA
jgi:hypothetical protein